LQERGAETPDPPLFDLRVGERSVKVLKKKLGLKIGKEEEGRGHERLCPARGSSAAIASSSAQEEGRRGFL